MKIDQYTGNEKKKIIATWSGKWLGRWHWWIDEFIFEKQDSEKDDVSNYQTENILIPEADIHVIENWEENPEDIEKGSQEDRIDVPEETEREKGKGKSKKVEVPCFGRKKGFTTPKQMMQLFSRGDSSFSWQSHTIWCIFYCHKSRSTAEIIRKSK